MRVVFLGNHDVGIAALSVLIESTEIVGVVAHPEDPEDGVRYQSLHDYAIGCGLNTIRGKATTPGVIQFIKNCHPELIWITDYRYLLPKHLLSIAHLGAINLHPSLLPKYRGRAPINWAIINGEDKIGLTAHYVDSGMDSGDIIEQEYLNLDVDEDVSDALRKLLPLYVLVTRRIINNLVMGTIVKRSQISEKATYYPARKPNDGQIDWNQPIAKILNLIRAVTDPYPGAFSFLNDEKIIIWKARVVQSTVIGSPGLIVGFDKGAPVIDCLEGRLALIEFECADHETCKINIGDQFMVKELI